MEEFEIVTVSSARRPSPLHVDVRLGCALVGLVSCGTASLFLATDAMGAGSAQFAASVLLTVGVIAVTAWCIYGRTDRSLSAVTLSPYSVAAATWTALFVLRPVELYFFPDHASLALGELGFGPAALTRAVAIGGMGCAAWCVGYVTTLGRWHSRRPRGAAPPQFHWVFGALALLVGTLLWGLLFVREGGVHALVASAVSMRAHQRSSAYGFIGVWIVQGTGLCALIALLGSETHGTRRALRAFVAAAVVLSAAAAVALQLRGLAVFAALSALAILLSLRPPSTKKLVVGAIVATLLAAGLAFAQQVRAYTSRMPPAEAVRAASETPLWANFVSDFGTFDDLVAMRDLVPGSIPFLRGTTLREIPEAVVPRSLWREKPLGVDARAASYLYPGTSVAVPISLQGELYWNYGLVAIFVGSLTLGAAFGAVGRLGLRADAGSGTFLLYAVTLPFTHAFLTRGLSATTESFVFALFGVFFASLALGFQPGAVVRRGLSHSRWRPRKQSETAPTPNLP